MREDGSVGKHILVLTHGLSWPSLTDTQQGLPEAREDVLSDSLISVLSYWPTKPRHSGHERPFLALLPEEQP